MSQSGKSCDIVTKVFSHIYLILLVSPHAWVVFLCIRVIVYLLQIIEILICIFTFSNFAANAVWMFLPLSRCSYSLQCCLLCRYLYFLTLTIICKCQKISWMTSYCLCTFGFPFVVSHQFVLFRLLLANTTSEPHVKVICIHPSMWWIF